MRVLMTLLHSEIIFHSAIDLLGKTSRQLATLSRALPSVANCGRSARDGGPRGDRGKWTPSEDLRETHSAGLEPATLGSEDRCSVQLSYECNARPRALPAAGGNRTLGGRRRQVWGARARGDGPTEDARHGRSDPTEIDGQREAGGSNHPRRPDAAGDPAGGPAPDR